MTKITLCPCKGIVCTARAAVLSGLLFPSEPPASHRLQVCAEEEAAGKCRWSSGLQAHTQRARPTC